jgi:hypothetical protein
MGSKLLGFAEDAVKIRSADWALALGHAGTLVIDHNIATSGTLLLALDAIEFALIGIRHSILLGCEGSPALNITS